MTIRMVSTLMTLAAVAVADPGWAISGRVLDVCSAEDGGAWLATASAHVGGSDAILLIRIDAAGGAVFVDTLGIVREDAASCRLISMENGGCAAAVEVGIGYTGTALRCYDSELMLNWKLVEDGFCYDSPYELLEMPEGGLLLLWDSWSDDRGLWVMRVSPGGETIWRSFVIPTAHPFYSCLCIAPGGDCVVTASTVTLADENAAVQLNGDGGGESGWSVGDLESLGAFSSMGLWNSEASLLSAWSLEPVPDCLDTLLMVELLPGGELGMSWLFTLDHLSNSSLLDALPGGGFVLSGVDTSSESMQPWIGITDDTGTVEWSHTFADNFTPVAMDISHDGFAVVAGDPMPGTGSGASIIVRLELGGEQIWTIR